jgi:hypothetical protein
MPPLMNSVLSTRTMYGRVAAMDKRAKSKEAKKLF